MHAGNIQDRDGAKFVLNRAAKHCPNLQHLWADGGYAGKLIAWAKDTCDYDLEVVKRTDDFAGFKVVPKRWIVERTLSWLNNYRRLSKDYEHNPKTSEALLQLAMIHLMVRRLG